MATTACPRCGRTFAADTADTAGRGGRGGEFDSLAETPGVEQPPEAAGMLAGARPFDAPEGSASDAIEYTSGGGELCPDCRAELRRRTS